MARKKKERKLTAAEQKRLDRFNETCESLASQGFARIDLGINLVAANVVAIAVLVVLFVTCLPLFFATYPQVDVFLTGTEFAVLLIAFVVLIVAHELVHGLTWSFFAPQRFKDIELGIMWNSLTPYCTCLAPLPKGPYILGALMPLVVFGIIPVLAGFAIGSLLLLNIGILMTVAAAGDVMIVIRVLRHKPNPSTRDLLLYDHPTEAGCVVFER